MAFYLSAADNGIRLSQKITSGAQNTRVLATIYVDEYHKRELRDDGL